MGLWAFHECLSTTTHDLRENPNGILPEGTSRRFGSTALQTKAGFDDAFAVQCAGTG